jgi:hypothetical protein
VVVVVVRVLGRCVWGCEVGWGVLEHVHAQAHAAKLDSAAERLEPVPVGGWRPASGGVGGAQEQA